MISKVFQYHIWGFKEFQEASRSVKGDSEDGGLVQEPLKGVTGDFRDVRISKSISWLGIKSVSGAF